jgi:hypothetical protein
MRQASKGLSHVCRMEIDLHRLKKDLTFLRFRPRCGRSAVARGVWSCQYALIRVIGAARVFTVTLVFAKSWSRSRSYIVAMAGALVSPWGSPLRLDARRRDAGPSFFALEFRPIVWLEFSAGRSSAEVE